LTFREFSKRECVPNGGTMSEHDHGSSPHHGYVSYPSSFILYPLKQAHASLIHDHDCSTHTSPITSLFPTTNTPLFPILILLPYPFPTSPLTKIVGARDRARRKVDCKEKKPSHKYPAAPARCSRVWHSDCLMPQHAFVTAWRAVH
jgi:hypothetical protein